MQVLLVNGSPHQHGCTFTALDEVRKTLEEEGIGTQMYWVGTKPIAGCIDCRRCGTLKKCVFNDKVNEFLGMAADFDGFFFGTPVHWAASDGFLTSFLSRAFFVCQNGGVDTFYLKPAAGVVSARRAGTTSTWDQINKYFGILEMPIVTSQYWKQVHGRTPDEVRQDTEGMQTMRTLARNMAYMLRCKEAAKKAGVPLPKREPVILTDFIH